jgi:hypothetical protein
MCPRGKPGAYRTSSGRGPSSRHAMVQTKDASQERMRGSVCAIQARAALSDLLQGPINPD